MGRGIVPVCAALAAAAVPGCSRTGLDDGIAFRPGGPGVPSEDAASSGADAFPSSSSGGGESSSGAGGRPSSESDGADGRPSSESDGADLFSPHEPDADSAGQPRAIDGQGPGAAPCGAGSCAGCCAGDGTCRSGFETSACGNGGQPCMECEAERSCNDRGTCL
jgi:hypothetical protein